MAQTATAQQPSAAGGTHEIAADQVQRDVPEATGVLPHGASCERCGALIDADDPFCPYCGTRRAQSPAHGQPAAAQRYFQCPNCGSQIAADPQARSTVCPFCDAAMVVEYSPDMTGRQSPEFVIGFAITAEQAQAKFSDWVRAGGMFRPGDLERAQIDGKLRGIYLPFWSFSMLAQSSWSAQIGEYWYRTESYTTTDSQGKTVTRTRRVRETEWWPLQGRHHRFYSHYLVSGSRGLAQNEADRIKPFHLAALHRYAPSFLAGWLTEEYSVGAQEAMQRSMQEFRRQEHEHIAKFLPGDTHSGLNVQTDFSRATSDLILLPIYLATYRYGGKPYRFLINGQTGAIAGDKPLSALRIALFAMVLAALVGVAVYLFWAKGR
jgi:hypothetical protein